MTCAVYLTSFGRLVCGQSDGSIAVLSALQAATVLMLEPRRFSRGKYAAMDCRAVLRVSYNAHVR